VISLIVPVSVPERVLAADLASAVPSSRVRLSGWVHRRRDLSAVTFLIVRDRSGLAQVVLEPDAARQLDVAEEWVVDVTGTATPNPVAPGGVELTDPGATVLSAPTDPRQRALSQLSAAALRGFRSTLDGLGFTEIQTPKIVANATESGANVFQLG